MLVVVTILLAVIMVVIIELSVLSSEPLVREGCPLDLVLAVGIE